MNENQKKMTEMSDLKKRYEIVHLSREQWQGRDIPLGYTTTEYFDVKVDEQDNGFMITMDKKPFDQPVSHTPEEYDFPDKLYAEYWDKACAWGIVENNELLAVIETAVEEWSNRLRITELWITPALQGQGYGHALMEVAKERARLERRRAIILETQSCNVHAIGFYRHEGFQVIGMDTCCYTNQDIERREVRIEMGYIMPGKKRLAREDVIIREEKPDDYHKVERLTQEAFWNKHQQGCDEHYLVHILRKNKDYLPELSRIAEVNGEIIGTIMYSKAQVRDDKQIYDIVTFGPLCIKPDWQGCGVGEFLLHETMELAAKAGYAGIVIYGEPDYYPRVGFQTCDYFGITTPDGKNFDAFMGIELNKDAMKDIHGKFYESDAFEQLDKEAVETFNNEFGPLTKQYYPCQW